MALPDRGASARSVRLVQLPTGFLDALLARDLDLASRLAGALPPPFFLTEDWLWRLRSDQIRHEPTSTDWIVRAVVDEDDVVVDHAGFMGHLTSTVTSRSASRCCQGTGARAGPRPRCLHCSHEPTANRWCDASWPPSDRATPGPRGSARRRVRPRRRADGPRRRARARLRPSGRSGLIRSVGRHHLGPNAEESDRSVVVECHEHGERRGPDDLRVVGRLGQLA